jgi:hypothetical protein
VGFSDQEHQQWLALFEKGSIKQKATACVGAARYIENEDPARLLREIAIQYSGDGLVVEKLKVNENGKVEVSAKYG